MTSPLTYVYLLCFVAGTFATSLVAVLTPAQPARRAILGAMICGALWALSDVLSNLATTPDQLRAVGMVFAVAWPPLGYFVLRAGLAYAGHHRILHSTWASLLLALPVVACVYLTLSGRLHSQYIPAPVNGIYFHNKATQWQYLVDLYFLVYTGVAGALLLRARRRTALEAFDGPVRLVLGISLPAAILGGAVNGTLSLFGLTSPFLASVLINAIGAFAAVKMVRGGFFTPIATYIQQRDEARDGLLQRDLVLEGIPAAVAIIGQDGARLFCNNRYLQLVGSHAPDQPPPFLARRLLDPGEIEELELAADDGEKRTIRIHADPLAYSDTRAVLFTLVDVTHQKALEAQLMEAQKLEAIGALAGGVAHDMNNNLSAIMNCASVLRLELPPHSECLEVVDQILAASRRGRDLTRNLLGFARRGRYIEESVDLNHTVREVIDLLRRTVSKQITFDVQLCSGTALIVGDPSQLHQAMLNLCLNSVEAMPDGGTLTLSTRIVAGATGHIEIRIADSGVGMDPHTHKHCLEPLFTTKPPGKGTGLGLPMAMSVVHSHDGTLALHSEQGKGTTVVLSLPAHSGPVGPAAAPREFMPGQPGKAVLLVDDDRLLLQAGERLLQSLGYRTLVASDGDEALCVLNRNADVLLVILDLIMPGRDGASVFQELRQRYPHVPVLLASGHGKDHVARGLLEQGAAGFLPKPFDADELARAIAESTVTRA